MRDSWTDARLDDFAAHTDQRFDAIDKRFDTVDRRFESLERRMDAGFAHLSAEVGLQRQETNARFDALNRTLLQVGGGIIATLIAGFFGVVIS